MKKILDRFDSFCKKHWFACDMFAAAIVLVFILLPFLVHDISDTERYIYIIFMYGFLASGILIDGVLESIRKLKKDVDKKQML